MEVGGYYLEKAGKLQSASIVVSLIGGGIGGLCLTSRTRDVQNFGIGLIGVAEVTSFILYCCSVSKTKKSGVVFQGNGIAYKF